MNTNAKLFDLSNYFTYGLSFSYTTSSRPRNRQQVSLTTGIATQTSGGETYPNKNFPDTNTVQVGAYVQDEINAGRLTVTPAVRVDYYGLNPNPDADFWRSSGAVNLLPTASTLLVGLAKLGMLYRFTDKYSGFFQYARGFRAPPYDNANFAFNNADVVLPDPAQRQPQARDQRRLRGRRSRQVQGRLELAARGLLQSLQQLHRDGGGRHAGPDHPVPVRQPQQRHDLGLRGARRASLPARMERARLLRLRPRHRHADRPAGQFGRSVEGVGAAPLRHPAGLRRPAHRHAGRRHTTRSATRPTSRRRPISISTPPSATTSTTASRSMPAPSTSPTPSTGTPRT